jgi:hypothetical protein
MQHRNAADHLGWILNFVFRGLHYKEIVLSVGGLSLSRNFDVNAGKPAWTTRSTCRIWVPAHNLLEDIGRTTEKLIELAGRRTFRIYSEFQPAARLSNTGNVPAGSRCVFYCLKKRGKIVEILKIQRVAVHAVTVVYGILTRKLRFLTA